MSTHPSTSTTTAPSPSIDDTPKTLAAAVAACQRQFDPWETRPLPNRADATNASTPSVTTR